MKSIPIYVYVDRRADDNEPFYVGKGRLLRTKDYKQRNKLWRAIVEKHGVVRQIVFETLDEQAALDEEARLVFELKTRDYFGGANKDDGGQGPLGYKHIKSAREVLSLLTRKRLRTPEGRQWASEKFSRMWREERERIMATHIRGTTHHKARLSDDDVIQVRQAYREVDMTVRGAISRFYEEWAAKLSVTPENLFRVVHRKSWTHLP